MHLRGAGATKDASVAVALEDERALALPIVGSEICVSIIGAPALSLLVKYPLVKNNLEPD